MIRPTVARIRTENLIHNIKTIMALDPQQKFVLPVVKANSYGHGDINIVSTLEKHRFPRVAVGLIEEGIRIRDSGYSGEIYMLGPFPKSAIKEIEHFKIVPLVNGWSELEAIKAKPELKIHIKFDTGMGRLGFRPEEADQVFTAVKGLNLKGVCSHLAKGDDFTLKEVGDSHRQKVKFENILKQFATLGCTENHLFNTDGATAYTQTYKNLPFGMRPGLGIYGYTTVPGQLSSQLRPVLKLESEIAHLKWIEPGDGVSYNSTWKADKRSRIAVVPIGYADGFHRSLSNKGRVSVLGKRLPIVGIICMDYFMVDASEISEQIQVGTKVEIFGDEINLSEVAAQAGTIPWEILTSLSERIRKVLE